MWRKIVSLILIFILSANPVLAFTQAVPLAPSLLSGFPIRTFGNDKFLDFGSGNSLILKLQNSITHYIYDGLGSVTALTDKTGRVIQSYNYDSFGNIFRPLHQRINQPYTYTGREYDQETGLYYYRNRYYDPKIGRFITQDPIGYEGGMNLYGYVKNNPVNYYDPFGEDTYRINNKFNSSKPTIWPWSHGFVAVTDINPNTDEETVTETYSWVNVNGGMWEKIDKEQNRIGAEAAIKIKKGAWRKGGEDLDAYIRAEFENRKDEKGGFGYLSSNSKGTCKNQANKLLSDALKKKAINDAIGR